MTLTRLLELTPAVRTTLLLVGSNVFMTFCVVRAPEEPPREPLIVAIAASWGIALFEYILQVPREPDWLRDDVARPA